MEEVDLFVLYRLLRAVVVSPEQPVTYTELIHRYEQATGVWIDPHFGWPPWLGELLYWCEQRGRPQLPAVVINGTTELPGQGFWGQPNTPSEPSLAAWTTMINAVYARPWPEELDALPQPPRFI